MREVARLALAFGEMRDRLAARTSEQERLLERVQDQAEQLQIQNEELLARSEALQSRAEQLRTGNQESHTQQEEPRRFNERLVIAGLELKRRAAELEAIISSITDGVMIQAASGEILRLTLPRALEP